MACGCQGGKIALEINLDHDSKEKIQEEVPNFLKRSGAKIARHILMYFTDTFASIVFKNGIIYTMDEDNPVVEAVAVRNETIIATGTNEDISAFQDIEKTKIVDLKGRVMLPGFIDPHMHMFPALFEKLIKLSPFTHNNMTEVKETLLRAAKNWNSKELLMCELFDPLITPGNFDVSLKALDAISETVPIFILETNGHVGHANSAAFKLAEVTKDTPDPPHAKFIRDGDGNLTGEIQQIGALNYFTRKLSKLTADDYKEGLNNLFEMASSQGCTSLHDCGIGAIDPVLDYSVILSVMDGNPPVRYSGYLVSTQWNHWMKQGLKPQKKDESLRINGIKAWADGSTQGGSAYEMQKYKIERWKYGFPNYSQEQLNKSVLVAHQQDWQVGIHANGDAAINMALNAFENAQKVCPKSDLRHRIEHTTICSRQQFERMKLLDVSPSFLIGHVYYYGQAFRDVILGEERAQLTDSVKTAIECGLRPTLHSDYNCQPISPLRCIHNAVTRILRNTKDEVLNINQAITPLQAVKAVTIDAAWQCHIDDIVGSIAKGKLADFVILDRDPLKIDPKEIINIKVEETWMNGVRRYSRYEQKPPKEKSQIQVMLSQLSQAELSQAEKKQEQ